MTNEDIKILFRYTKYLLPLLTLWSLTRLVIFYSQFNINIGNYISIQEVLTPFINDIVSYIFTILIPSILLTFFFGEKIAQDNLERFKANKKNPFWERAWKDIKTFGWFWLILLVTIIIYIYENKPVEQILSILTLWPLAYLIFWIRKEALIKTDFKFTTENTAYFNVSTILIIFFLLSISQTFSKIDKIKNQKILNPTTIDLEKDQIICKDTLAYIGRTKDYDKKN